MDREIAGKLVKELKKHRGLIAIDEELFLDVLVSSEVPKSSRFYEKLPYKQQAVEESNRYYYFSLRRLLRNRRAKDYQLSRWKKSYEAIASTFGIYSSDALNRNLRTDSTLIDMMAICEEPFSLLGKFQTYDFDNPNETLFIVTRPVLIIPGAKDMEKIYNWEEANTTYEKEVRLMGFLPTQKRIPSQEYFLHQIF